MKTILKLALLALVPLVSRGGIERISDGGVSINLPTLLPAGEPSIVVLHTPWDQESISLLERIEQWSGEYPDMAIFFVDCVDPRTQVYRQFSLDAIPSVLIFNREQELVGIFGNDFDRLIELLEREGFL